MNDEDSEGEYVHLLCVVAGWTKLCLWGHVCLRPWHHCVRASSCWIHQLSNSKVGDLGSDGSDVDEYVISREVLVCSGRGGAMEVGQSEGHLTEDGDLVLQMEGLLWVCLQEL